MTAVNVCVSLRRAVRKLTTINAARDPPRECPMRLEGRIRRQAGSVALSTQGFMPVAAIHVIPDDSFDDWVVRDERGMSSAIIRPVNPPS
jgi:hypothetical protein